MGRNVPKLWQICFGVRRGDMEVKDEIEVACKYCDELVVSTRQGHDWYRCRHGRFDVPERFRPGHMIPRYFAWSGIWKPNKTVAKAQENCPLFVKYVGK